eukprot:358498-Chlamydomonas_euryale.AAC.1
MLRICTTLLLLIWAAPVTAQGSVTACCRFSWHPAAHAAVMLLQVSLVPSLVGPGSVSPHGSVAALPQILLALVQLVLAVEAIDPASTSAATGWDLDMDHCRGGDLGLDMDQAHSQATGCQITNRCKEHHQAGLDLDQSHPPPRPHTRKGCKTLAAPAKVSPARCRLPAAGRKVTPPCCSSKNTTLDCHFCGRHDICAGGKLPIIIFISYNVCYLAWPASHACPRPTADYRGICNRPNVEFAEYVDESGEVQVWTQVWTQFWDEGLLRPARPLGRGGGMDTSVDAGVA